MAINKLVQKYSDEFLEKVFYFCLKKCSNPVQAEDLAGEINHNILNSLSENFVPENFNAWVWAIARNRYSKWATNNRLKRENILPDDVSEYKCFDNTSFEDDIIQAEQLNILRRELAFVTKEYREILIAYYIDGKKTEEIAKSFHIPKGTVVSKLHRIRKKLKEGFEMSREFGTLSYKPENIGFVMNGSDSRNGAPWSFVSRLIAKNIILAAYRNPMTAEELAIEMGIALPYMEDELSKLANSTLIKKKGDKYETAIFIVSCEAQEQCNEHMESIASELADLCIRMVEFRVKCYEKSGVKWHEGYQAYEDMKWTLLMEQVDKLDLEATRQQKSDKNNNIGHNGCTIRPDNGMWDLLGMESCEIGRPPFIGLHGTGETPDYSNSGYNYQFGQFKFNYERINDKTPVHLSNEHCRALVDCARNRSDSSPARLLDELVDYGYLSKDNGEYHPTFMVQFMDNLSKLSEKQNIEYRKLYDPAIKLLSDHYMVCKEAVTKEVPAFLREDEHQIRHAISQIMFPRGSVLKQALDTGWITYDKTDSESAKRRMLGASLLIG